ncbi:MAG: hypothetical protein U1E67_00305 [Hyphomicrobiales bacterium]
MTKHLLSLAAAAALLAFAIPAGACDMHASHAQVKTAEAAPAPVPVPEAKPVTVIRTQIEEPAEPAIMSKPYASEGGYMDCHRRAKEQTVYLTQ